MNDFEDILNAYIEGVASRADAEALLRRLHLTSEQRAQVEMTLRLADGISDAAQAVPAPGAEEQLRERLRAHMRSSAGELDESLAARLLAPAGRVRKEFQRPDVLAAGDEETAPED